MPIWIVVAAALLAPPTASPQTPLQASANSTPTQPSDVAKALIDIFHPDEETLEVNVKSWEAISRRDTYLAELEAEYPGISDSVIAACRPIAIHYLQEMVSRMKLAKARIFADRLTIEELREILAFYSSSAGQRFTRAMTRNVDVDAYADDLSSGEAGSADAADVAITRTFHSTLSRVIDETSAEDMAAISRFETSPVALKSLAVGMEADRATSEVAANPDPEWLEKQAVAYDEAVTKFVERFEMEGDE